tara:strand:+ start:2253 stop:2489 length:237 start_codon:yes stop_codon:yes gene_type:complete
MKKLKLLFALIIISCVTYPEDIVGNCFVSPDPNRVCTEEYEPVCACNDLVYANSCKAEKAGNLIWKPTNKDSGEECNF